VTLVGGVVNPRGVVIGADGLGTVGNVQIPADKVVQIGAVFGCGVSGVVHIAVLASNALVQSPLAQAGAGTYTKDQATTLARDARRDATTAYVQHVTWVNTQPIDAQIGAAQIVLRDLCSDGPLLVCLDNRGNSGPPHRPNYTAIGSATEAALLLIQAYSAYDYATHPLDTSVLLTKRVLDQVAAAIPNIGGVLKVLAISVQPDEHGTHSHFVDLTSAKIQDGLATWHELEAEMFQSLAATPQAAEPGEAAAATVDDPIPGHPPAGAAGAAPPAG